MSGYTMKVEWDQVDAIVKSEIRTVRDDMEAELNKIENGEERMFIFSYDDLSEEMSRILALKNASELLLEYWGETC